MARLCHAVVAGTNLLAACEPQRLTARIEESWRVLLPGLVTDGARAVDTGGRA
ncbi:hypothetical protein [Saccharopolyspora rhizosphaerae]|uniref:hypothetical protein n=1 Tax=Saccharopolyspora rhizosphaerae TaxID=2492662 RepID=UPI0013153A5C|nr:hypothetical protein [Saccharopolyspora rhizosphaerae]